MANLRQIRTRIRSVQNTQKITRAMQMVAGAKLRRAQEQLLKARPYVDRLEGVARRFLASAPDDLSHPLLPPDRAEPVEGRTVSRVLIGVATDTGLCGAYNERVLAETRRAINESA
ncbi:MAG: F0F1 ATP synthase subunit gamma, partial [Candidatus Omnitrophica bacterium]|nr:F0F1 ATP synthase subunit gamma [Candidatus Omnitrophota bacterium]